MSSERFRNGGAPSTPGTGTFMFQPRSVAAQSQASYPNAPTVAAGPVPMNMSGYQGSHVPPSGQYPPFQEGFSAQTQPSIRNPFPLPGQNGQAYAPGAVDPEMEAQIAQWQSAYSSKDSLPGNAARSHQARNYEGGMPSTGANAAALGPRPEANKGAYPHVNGTQNAGGDSGVAEVVVGADGKQKTVVRQGGGQTWQDPSLLEWNPAHFRLFVGNLAGEVTDDSLLKAFSRYESVQKARVVRDKRTTKSKGYGFVSFSDGDEYFQAARDMQGKYIGSHPVLLRKSTTEIRPTVSKDNDRGQRRGKGGKGGNQMGPRAGNGVPKRQGKMKNGLKILG